MTLYDSSTLIDYLAGVESVVKYVESHVDERAVAPPLVLFEVYQGEVYKTGPADFDSVDLALSWLTVVDETAEAARRAAELQQELQQRGETLAARDAYIAGTAIQLGERLAVTDTDFEVDAIFDFLDVQLL